MANCAGLPNVIQPGSLTPQDQSIVDNDSETEEDAADYQEIWTSAMGKGPYENPSMYRKVEVLILCWAEDCDDWAESQREVKKLKKVFEGDFYYHAEIKFLHKNSPTKLQLQVNTILAGFATKHDGPNTLFIVYYTGHGKLASSYGSLLIHGKNSENDARKRQDTLIWNKSEALLQDAGADVLEIFDCCYAGTLSLTKGNYRLFEYIAATRAMETTPRPGETSFTAALIYALRCLLDEKKGRRFTTTELMGKIVKAPNFPEDQAPQLSDRLENSPGGRIMLHPLPRPGSNPQAASCEPPKFLSSEIRKENHHITEETKYNVRDYEFKLSPDTFAIWYCGHCNLGPMSSAIDKYCAHCAKPMDGYSRHVTLNRNDGTETLVSDILKDPTPRQSPKGFPPPRTPQGYTDNGQGSSTINMAHTKQRELFKPPGYHFPLSGSMQPDAPPTDVACGNALPNRTTAEGEEEWTLKCICGFGEDDGRTILCGSCETWQHIECYYYRKELNPEESHLCADCDPSQPVDANGAAERQRRSISGLERLKRSMAKDIVRILDTEKQDQDQAPFLAGFSSDTPGGYPSYEGMSNVNDQSDASSIASVPSMFSGTTLSSMSVAYGSINVAVEELLYLLLNDQELRTMFDIVLQRVKPDKFERNFTKLLKVYAVELKRTAVSELDKAAVHLVYSQRKYVTNRIRRVYVPDNSKTVEDPHTLIAQNPGKDKQLEKFLRGRHPTIKANDPDDVQSSDDSNMGDPEQPCLPNLTHVRHFMTSGTAFENLKKNFDRFINPQTPKEPEAPHGRKRRRSPSIDDLVEEISKRRKELHTDDEVIEPCPEDAREVQEAKSSQGRKRQRSPSIDDTVEECSKRPKGQHPPDTSGTDYAPSHDPAEGGDKVQLEVMPSEDLLDPYRAESAGPLSPSDPSLPVPPALKGLWREHELSGKVKMESESRSPATMKSVDPFEPGQPQTFSGSVVAPSSNAQRGDALSIPGTAVALDEFQSLLSSKKKHYCPVCLQGFTRYHNLERHLLTHRNEKPYVCQTCDSRFRRLHDLKRHKTLHTGERLHECSQCRQRFARADTLVRHSKGSGGCAGRKSSDGSFGASGAVYAGGERTDGLLPIEEGLYELELVDEDAGRPDDRGPGPKLPSRCNDDDRTLHIHRSPQMVSMVDQKTAASERASPITEAQDPLEEITVTHRGNMNSTNMHTGTVGTPFQALRRYWNMWRRPRLRPGYRRLEWTCDCGEDLHGDFDNANPEAVNHLHMILQNSGYQSTGQPSQPQAATSPTPSAASISPVVSNISNNATQHTFGTPTQSMVPKGCNMQPSPDPHTRKFLELCVNTGKFHKSLGEIDITNVNCDRDLFTLTKQRYAEVRGHRSRFFLLEPTAVEWVQFSLEERHRVGILLRPKAVPPENEVVSKHYEYAPCPLDALPPIPDNIFLHHLTNPGPHRRPVWLRRLPKKVNDSILGSHDELVTGWGVHIIEGPNWLAVWQVAFCIVSTSGVFGITWSIYRSDVSGAFGVASWMTSVFTILMMVCFSKWSGE